MITTKNRQNTMELRQAVILAGGRGERLRPITDTVPKPMVMLNGKPFLEYLITYLKRQGVTEVVILLGYLHQKVTEYFGDGLAWGISIKYSIGQETDETGKRIYDARHLLDNTFLLMYCDNYLSLNISLLEQFHKEKRVPLTVTIYTNKDSFTQNNMRVDTEGYVDTYDKTRTMQNLSGVDVGFFIVDKEVISMMPNTNFSFQKEILPKLIEEHKLAGYLTDLRYYSIGNVGRLLETELFLKPKKVVFLDRDGVINKKAPKAEYITSWDAFEFLPDVIPAMRQLADKGYELYVITNQAGIARGIMTLKQLDEIHNKMCKRLGEEGIHIKQIYYCPHGWDEGCICRKPKPGMFFAASKEHKIDLTTTYFIGDDERDKIAGDAAGTRTFLITPTKSFLDIAQEIITHETVHN